MTYNYNIFISNKRKSRRAAKKYPCSNVVLLFRYSFGMPLVLLWLSYKALKRIRSAFLDDPSGRSTSGCLFLKGLKKAERKDGLKVIQRYTLLTNIGSSAHEAGLVATRRYVWNTMNISFEMRLINKLNSLIVEIIV